MKNDQIKSYDWLSLALYLLICVVGIFMIYSSSNSYQLGDAFSYNSLYGRQLIFFGLSLGLIFACNFLNVNFWRTFAYPIYLFSLLLLVAVLIFGKEINGAKSWFDLGFFRMQPSEIAKFGTNLALTSYLSSGLFNPKTNKSIGMVLALMGVPFILILLQSDAGSALILTSFFILLYRAGLPEEWFIGIFVIILCFLFSIFFNMLELVSLFLFLFTLFLGLYIPRIPRKQFMMMVVGLATINAVLIFFGMTPYIVAVNGLAFFGMLTFAFLRNHVNELVLTTGIFVTTLLFTLTANYTFHNFLGTHQQNRINAWLQPSKCSPGSLYNLVQSKVAIGSGGLSGKGFLNGHMTKGNYVPEQSTDFIFCTIGEEGGFIGITFLLALFLVLLIRIIYRSEQQRLDFVKYYGYGFAGLLFFHVLINVGMTMGVMPIIGIPLPFVSSGGSSLISFSLMFGAYLSMQRRMS